MHYLQEISQAFSHAEPAIQIIGRGDLPSPFRVTDLAAETIGYAGSLLQR